MRKSYLSGPINSKTPDGKTSEEHKDVFTDVQRFMRRHYGDWEVINPCEVGTKCVQPRCGEFEGHSWYCWLKADLKVMLDCDSIIMLPNWENSAGAQLEVQVARAVGINVYYAVNTERGGWLLR